MVLLQKIKALLGLGESEMEDREVGVTVERDGPTDEPAGTTEPDEPAESVPDETVLGEESVEIDETGSEPDGNDPLADEGTDTADDADEPADAAAAGSSAAGSTGSITEPADSPEEATEPAEAAGPSDDDAVPESGAATVEGDQPVDTIKGIGPAYAERLADAGVETVGDLATADSEDVASETGIAPTRVQGWIDSANSR